MLFKSTLKLSITTSTGLLIGLLSQFYILFYFGTSIQTDAHIVSLTIPLLISSVFVVTLPQILVPIFLDQDDAGIAAWHVMIPLAAFFTVLSLALFLLAPFYIPLLFFGLNSDASQLAIELTKIQVWSILSAGLTIAPMTLLRAQEKILFTEIRSLIASTIGLVALVPATQYYGILGASLVFLLRSWIHLILVIPVLGSSRITKPSKALYRTIWHRTAPWLLAAPIYKLSPIVDRVLAANSPVGHLSSLVYGQQFWNSGLRIIDRSLATPFLTRSSKAVKSREIELVSREYRVILRTIFMITSLILSGFWLWGDDLILLLTEVSNFPVQSVYSFWLVTLVLGGTFIAGGWSQVSTAAMYSLGMTRYLTRVAITTFFLSTAVKILLFVLYGVPGLAVGCVLYPLLNHLMFHRKFVAELRSMS